MNHLAHLSESPLLFCQVSLTMSILRVVAIQLY
jgi:hypothetical protein